MVGLVMAPTRELADQIYSEARMFCRALNINVVRVIGGSNVGGQLTELK